jgi:hypothetical protein
MAGAFIHQAALITFNQVSMIFFSFLPLSSAPTKNRVTQNTLLEGHRWYQDPYHAHGPLQWRLLQAPHSQLSATRAVVLQKTHNVGSTQCLPVRLASHVCLKKISRMDLCKDGSLSFNIFTSDRAADNDMDRTLRMLHLSIVICYCI